MNPDIYMPFYWPDFWQAVKSWPDSAIVGYQKALTHYWFHEHCRGLPDDSEQLRRICERDRSEWEECCGLIFDNDRFFKQDANGLWQQKKALKIWRDAKAAQEFAKARAINAARTRWGR